MTARKAGGTSGKTATSRRAGAKSRRSAAGRVGDGWQAEKSALTRQAILEAAVRCFVEHGYANTTTAMIADEASVSRGAMMHHFPSRSAVMNAVVGYLHVRRLNEYRALMTDIDSPDQTLTRAAIRVSVVETGEITAGGARSGAIRDAGYGCGTSLIQSGAACQ